MLTPLILRLASMTNPIKRFEKNIDEVKRLLEIHEQLAGKSAGRKYNVEVLNKSAIVLLVACWEAFIEDLAASAFKFMLAHATAPAIFPDDVLAQASKKLKSAQDNREVWRLAGIGWQTVLEEHREELFKEYIGKLNTPKPKQVDSLFNSLFGLSTISSKWYWHKSPHDKACQKLVDLIELRGAIAHQVAAGKSVKKMLVYDYMWFIHRLAVISSNLVRDHAVARTKKVPWPGYKFTLKKL